MAQGNATIKSVLSGDTVILLGNAKTNGAPPAELMLSLSSLQAPRWSMNSIEPFGWQSREFLRHLLIGKTVEFKVDYSIPSSSSTSSTVTPRSREFGSIWLNPNPNETAAGVDSKTRQNVNLLVAAAGFARVKSSNGTGNNQEMEEMQRLESIAIAEKKGMHASVLDTKMISATWSGWNAQEVLDQYSGKPVSAMVENFRDGASMRLLLLEPMYVVNFSLTGVQCPRMNTPSKALAESMTAAASTTLPEGPAPFAREAKHFAEVRLLNRDIQVLLEGVDSHGNFFGTVVHKAGNISVELLKNGLAKMSDWSASYLPPDTRSLMRNCERSAKLQLLRVWRSYKPTVVLGDKAYEGKVIEVCSGDTIIVLVSGSEERRVSLSSLRAPRLGNVRKGEVDAPYAIESKEYLRKILIGKKVKVLIDYERAPAPTAVGPANTTRSFGSVFLLKAQDQVNIAVMVVKEGLAEVVRHRADDERSSCYDECLAAEAEAQTLKKGRFSTKNVVSNTKNVTDLTTDPVKAKQYLPFLKREKKVRGVVEFVSSGTRMKIFIPKENCLLNFVASGIKCPNPERKAAAAQGYGKQNNSTTAAQPFGEEAKTFAREHLMQRTVEVEVEDMDRGGTAFGPIVLKDRLNFGVALLSAGLATTDAFSIDRTSCANALVAAEAVAKAAKAKIWSTYTPETVTSTKIISNSISYKTEKIGVKMSEIISGGNFFVLKSSNSTAMASLEQKLATFTKEKGCQGDNSMTIEGVKRGATVAALFNGVWCRAKIEFIDRPNKTLRVRYIDYGNLSTLPISKIRALDPALISIPALATECVLAFLKVPLPTEEFGQEAGMSFGDLTWNRPLVMQMHGRETDSNRIRVTLYDTSSSDESSSAANNVGEQLVKAGLARINRKEAALAIHPKEKEVYQSILAAQMLAKKSRVNMWQYGDIESDDEDPLY